MEVKKAELSCVGVNFSQYPKDGKAEIAFVGKSNVGGCDPGLVWRPRLFAQCGG